MKSKSYFNNHARIGKILARITGVLFLFYLISCNLDNNMAGTNATSPSAVRDLKVNSFTGNKMMFSWRAPTDPGTIDGATPATLSGFLVKYKEDVDSDFIEIDKSSGGIQLAGSWTGTNTVATVTGLNEDRNYTFLVVAVNSANKKGLDIQAPKIKQTVKQTAVPAIPKNFRKVLTCDKPTSVELRWDVSPKATFYKLYRDKQEISKSILTNFYADTGLTPSTSYTYEVQACSTEGCSGDSAPLTITTAAGGKTFGSIITSGKVPEDLSSYDERSQEVFSIYNAGAVIVAKYLKVGGAGDGSSFDNAAGDPKAVLDGITDATEEKIYVMLLTGGIYDPDTMAMKSHVAIVGGVNECLSFSDTATVLDGKRASQLFFNKNLSHVPALLYGITISNGKGDQGGGMYNEYSSPILTRVVFSGNNAKTAGGGMYNLYAFPTLTRVVFSNNASSHGGGMYNIASSPNLTGVTFIKNRAGTAGAGIYNKQSSPNLTGVTFSENLSFFLGGGMVNEYSSPFLVNVTFSGNTGTEGGGLYNHFSSPNFIEVTFSQNDAARGGAMYNDNNGEKGPLIVNGIFWGNTVSVSGAEIYFDNADVSQENLRIYNSIVERGTGNLISGKVYPTGFAQGGFATGGGRNPVEVSFSNIIAIDPKLSDLTNNGGPVWTHAIKSDSSAVGKGLYIKKKDSTLYYSANHATWYHYPDLRGNRASPPADAINLTAKDATGYTRSGIPDLGAYQAR